MNYANHIVISEKIHNKNSLLKSKSFAASFGVHASIALALSYIVTAHPIILMPSEDRVVISLNDFTPHDGDIHRMESGEKIPDKTIVPQQKQPLKPLHQIEKRPEPTPQSEPTIQTSERTPSLTPSVSPEASAPLISDRKPMMIPPKTHTDSPQTPSTVSEHQPPKSPVTGNDSGGAALGHIRNMIEKALIYPTVARKLRLEGVVTVFFVLKSDGSVETAKITSSSGSRILDNKAIETILSLSGDFPALGKPVDLSIPIEFSLQKL